MFTTSISTRNPNFKWHLLIVRRFFLLKPINNNYVVVENLLKISKFHLKLGFLVEIVKIAFVIEIFYIKLWTFHFRNCEHFIYKCRYSNNRSKLFLRAIWTYWKSCPIRKGLLLTFCVKMLLPLGLNLIILIFWKIVNGLNKKFITYQEMFLSMHFIFIESLLNNLENLKFIYS